ncbi:MAG: TonB-dependent receptor [Bacteroidota bacterium]|nr:TonB-dependent receptor [Bacteroidota bacterium]
MKSKVFNVIIFMFWINGYAQSQLTLIINTEGDNVLETKFVDVFDRDQGFIKKVPIGKEFLLEIEKDSISLVFLAEGFEIFEKQLDIFKDKEVMIILKPLVEDLSEVVIRAKNKEVFQLLRLKDFEKTAIYAGKKTEVILVEQSMANLASNNARQIYSQIPGLNIYQNDDAGLQLHIGGRGLDPNRTSNFNTRQNNYDISADVLGYPESYYTPPSEAIEEIQIVRGAASLQYGTQFGGLVNFKLKSSTTHKPLEITTRNTFGTNNLYTNFSLVSGNINDFKYLTFFNFKSGDGFRPNSKFDSSNFFFSLNRKFKDLELSFEITYLDYLAQQPGGLSDEMFLQNPFQSNRARNWFELNWFLYNSKIDYKLSDNSNFNFNFFGLKAQRNALGFRSNRVSQVDSNDERDLIKGDFQNFGFETRWLKKYKISKYNSVFLIGNKYYKSNNTTQQGPGSNSSGPEFEIRLDEYPNYSLQSNYNYPNENISFFTENIFYLNDKFSITPGARYEYIKTATNGSYKKINTDGAGNVILNLSLDSSESRKRSFTLFGLGLSYKRSEKIEYYANISQNYRSVTFADISIINPAFSINPNITDEKGFTADFGLRGAIDKIVSFDLSIFNLSYQDRIGFVQRAYRDGSVKSERGNVGDANIFGVESLIDFNIKDFSGINNKNYLFNVFLNFSFIDSKYIRSEEPGVTGKKVEFIPNSNIKTGLRFGYKNLLFSTQYTFLSSQYTDSSNAVDGNLSGVIGLIPSYEIVDISSSFLAGRFKFEFGINNLFDKAYYTRRATGYPGPGIITSPNRNIYFTTQVKI